MFAGIARRRSTAVACVLVLFSTAALAQDAPSRNPVNDRTASLQRTSPPSQQTLQIAEPAANQHPLAPAYDLALRARKQLESIADYSCVFVKCERIEGQLQSHESMFLKVRHVPFSVYLYCLGPQKPRGQEAIFVEGRNDGMVLAHTTGLRDRVAGTVSLLPTSAKMMEGNLRPITNVGIKNLVEKMIALHEYEMHYGECQVQIFHQAKIDDRVTTCVQIVHPVPRRNFHFYVARIYYDDQWQIPIRFEGYSWPTTAGGEPLLMEEYTYRNVELNRGFSEIDFDVANPAYQFH